MTRLPLVPALAESPVPLLAGMDPWQMGFGERAAIVGLLSELRPRLAVEVGTAEGGGLRRLAAHAEVVHAFDLREPAAELRELGNVVFHVGDSHVLLPAVLEQLAAEGEEVGFALVDGDHSADGVAQDVTSLLDSPAFRRGVIVAHDSINPEVRRGLERIDYEAWPKVRYVELDHVPGYLFREPLDGELWMGLALIVVDETHPRNGEPVHQTRYHDVHALLRRAREAEEEDARLREGMAALRGSASWRATAPLRRLKRIAQRH
jgi:Methyltransferase domain